MSQVVEIPDPVYSALEKAAQAVGTTPVGWIAAQLAKAVAADLSAASNQSLADRFAGRIGHIHGEGQTNFSERCGEQFSEHLETKKQTGHL
jgi:hypothetical protein